MGTQITVPSPQRRFLEPFKNRVFQYDTKHSNLFLSHYVNQILNAVGDDSIVRGLEVSPEVNSSKTGINFNISPGALVQDLTYFEFQKEFCVPMEDLVDFSEYYVVIYTNWRYIDTLYENPMKIEGTLYNPRTKRALNPWNPVYNRIILGVFSFTEEDGLITGVVEEDSNIFFDDANVIKNGTFDEKNALNWTPYSSTLRVVEEGGTLDSPYVEVVPAGGKLQGMSQAFATKPNATYEVSFYVKSNESTKFIAKIMDQKCETSMTSTEEIKTYTATSTKRWTLHTFRFNAFSNFTTLFLLKNSTSLENKIHFDHIYIFEYTPTRKRADLHMIAMIDGGRIPTTDDILPPVVEESASYQWRFLSINGQLDYYVDDTQPDLRSTRRGQYYVFFGGKKLGSEEYYIDWTNNRIHLNSCTQANAEISIFFARYPYDAKYQWDIRLLSNTYNYKPTEFREDFPDPANGTYLAFLNGELLGSTYYTIDFVENIIRFSSDLVGRSVNKIVELYYLTDPVKSYSWTFSTTKNIRSYTTDINVEKFPATNLGKYLVFLNGQKVADDKFTISSNPSTITLKFNPTANNLALNIFFIGNDHVVNETAIDDGWDVYHWFISPVDGVYSYKLDPTVIPLKAIASGYYMTFYNGDCLSPRQYSISDSTNTIQFSSSNLFTNLSTISDKTVDVYYIKRPSSGKYQWIFTSLASTPRRFDVLSGEAKVQNSLEGTYFTFVDGKKIDENKLTANVSQNRFTLASSVPISEGSTVHIYFIKEPVTLYKWSITTISGIDTYSPDESEQSFGELPDGEFLMFKNGKKMSPSEFKVNRLRNTLEFTEKPNSAAAHYLYFLGKE